MAKTTVNAKLLERLQTKLKVSRRQIDRLITDKANANFLPRNLAAIALAAEHGIPISKFATSDDLASIRHRGTAAQPPVTTSSPTPRRRGGPKAVAKPPKSSKRGKSVFVVHGRNEKLRRALFQFLRSLSLNPIEWRRAISLTKKPSPFVSEILDAAFREAVAVVVLLTPDDEARLKPEFVKENDPPHEKDLTAQARPNVLFEAGMAFGRHPEATVLVQVGEVRPFSDIAGRHIAHLSNSVESRQELIAKLLNAKCDVDTSGTDWQSEGDFAV